MDYFYAGSGSPKGGLDNPYLKFKYTANASMMKATINMPYAKAQATNDEAAASFDKTGTWAYLILKFTPDFFYSRPVAIKQ